jgi:cell division protein FtsX
MIMNRISMISVVVVGLLTFVGCSTVSMNYQRCAARTTADMSATTALEVQGNKIAPEQIIAAATAIKEYIQSLQGDVFDKEAVITELQNLVNISALNNIIRNVVGRVPDDMNIKDAKRMIIEACDGMILGAIKFDYNDVIKPEPVTNN